ncbi:MAG: TetR/AcrR family transcriptional regulator [Flammeovirgaceae bacterium]
METSVTKQRIIATSILLFNTDGIANVRLTQISDEAGISVGNLAYHYKNKEAIVEAVYTQSIEEFGQVLSEYLVDSSILDFDKQISSYYSFFKSNRFFLFNLFEIERNYPSIHNRWQRYISKMILQLRKRLDYLVDTGILKNENASGDFDQLAQLIWMTITFWIPQQVIRGKAHRQEVYRKAVWALLTPHLTPSGTEEYNVVIRPLIGQY